MSKTHEQALEEAVEEIEVPEAAFEAAVDKYKALTEWLERPSSTLAASDPYLSPQGSFALGTAIRPIGRDNEYDVDIICRLNWSKRDASQYGLKQAVGAEIKSYAERNSMSKVPKDKRRCWTLQYADGTKFHIDILPCIRDADGYRTFLKQRGLANFEGFDHLTENALAITDKTEAAYYQLCDDWPSSNPLGYAEWFKSRQAEILEEARSALVRKGLYAKAADVPDFKVKTPLQKVIMLLKRHRDSMFEDDAERKPISIIITTLAASAYRGTTGLVETLTDILPRLDEAVERRSGVAWIANPVNPAENFADRWSDDDALEAAFYDWLQAVRTDFGTYIRATRPDEIGSILKRRLNGNTASVAKEHQSTPVIAAPSVSRLSAAVGRVQERRTDTAPWVPHSDD